MLKKKNMYTTFFLLAYILIFYNLFLIQYFNEATYSQNSYPNTIIKQDTTSSTAAAIMASGSIIRIKKRTLL